MNKIIDFLTQNPIQYCATVGRDGKPKVRPVQFMFDKDGKLYFCTSNQKEVYKEIQGNAYIELCTSTSEFAWSRVSGKVVFSDDISIKEEILEKYPLVKSIYQEANNPTFEAFYLDEVKAVIADFSGNPPYVVE